MTSGSIAGRVGAAERPRDGLAAWRGGSGCATRGASAAREVTDMVSSYATRSDSAPRGAACRLCRVRCIAPARWLVALALVACAGDAAPLARPVAALQGARVTSPEGQVAAARPTGPQGQVPAGPPALRRHSVRADGHALAVYSKVPARPRAAVLLVHGRTWSGLPDFDLQVPGERVSLMDALAGAGVAAYAVDLRGYGETARDDSGFATPTRSAADVAEVLRFVAADAGAPGRPYLLGWSLGALVSALTVQQGPELAAGVVLYGYPCRGGAGGRRAVDPEAPRRAANTAASAASDFITPGSVSRAVVDAFVAAALRADPVRADWRRGEEWDALRFAALRVPVLVIHGERDPVTDRGCMADRFAELAGVDRRWVILAGGDHAAHLERSAAGFVAAVVEFVTAPVSAN